MELKQLKAKSAAELQAHLLDLAREQFSLRMQKGTGQLTQTHQIKNVRREIAQVKMLLGGNKQHAK
jgi:large subunit ribosomal protein L29